MNQEETWFSVLQRRNITRGIVRSVPNRRAAIVASSEAESSVPTFSWVKSADVILAKPRRPRITESDALGACRDT